MKKLLFVLFLVWSSICNAEVLITFAGGSYHFNSTYKYDFDNKYNNDNRPIGLGYQFSWNGYDHSVDYISFINSYDDSASILLYTFHYPLYENLSLGLAGGVLSGYKETTVKKCNHPGGSGAPAYVDIDKCESRNYANGFRDPMVIAYPLIVYQIGNFEISATFIPIGDPFVFTFVKYKI